MRIVAKITSGRHKRAKVRGEISRAMLAKENVMPQWLPKGREPSLDELLGDEMMAPVMRSAGMVEGELRALLASLAARVAPELRRRSACSAAPECPRQEVSRSL
jgi:hypothetical protein